MSIKRYLVIITSFLLSVVCFNKVVIADSFPPLPEALAALESDEDVTVSKIIVDEWPPDSNFYYAFEPVKKDPSVGFIIYPGAFVDPAAYAPAAHAIAAKGFLTVIIKMPGDIAITATDRATTVIDDYEAIEIWTIGGHSLGGVSSCAYAKENSEKVAGVILWASFPSESFRIDDKDLSAISIYGTNDGLVTLDEIEESRAHLPPDTQWVSITGGNHTQFGWYDTSPDPIQPNDNPADITREEQQVQIIQATVGLLELFNISPPAQAIPTLSEWGILICMTIIMGIGVVALLRRRIV